LDEVYRNVVQAEKFNGSLLGIILLKYVMRRLQ